MDKLIKKVDINSLISFEKVKAEIEKIETVDIAKAYRDKAETLRIYAKKIGKGLEVQNRCAEIKIRAERKAGQLLDNQLERGRPKKTFDNQRIFLKDFDISDFQSHCWQLIASLNNEQFEKHIIKIKKALRELTSSSILNLAKKLRPKERNILIPIEGTHEVIVIDPPWPYGTEYNKETRRVASPYKELPIEELEKFKLPAADNCVLWLWTTHKFLKDAFNLTEIWGFDYKLTFVWDKEKMGMGSWLRCQIEFCLLAIKGKPQWNLTNERDILRIARGRHSVKPDEFYKMVEKLCPTKGEYADIFFRKERPNWKGYGDKL